MGNLLEVTEATFEDEVLKSDKPTVVDFWAPWCGYCMKLTPVMEQISMEIPQAKFVKMNADESMNIAKTYSVSGLPCLMIFKDGQPQDRLVGSMPKSNIISTVQKYV